MLTAELLCRCLVNRRDDSIAIAKRVVEEFHRSCSAGPQKSSSVPLSAWPATTIFPSDCKAQAKPKIVRPASDRGGDDPIDTKGVVQGAITVVTNDRKIIVAAIVAVPSG